jgi:hypothetical protein
MIESISARKQYHATGVPCSIQFLFPQYIESLLLIPEFDPLENVLIFAIENGCHKLGMPSHLYQLAWYGRVQSGG